MEATTFVQSSFQTYVHLRAGDYAQAAEGLEGWTKSDGEKLPGLVTRRAKEKRMLLSK